MEYKKSLLEVSRTEKQLVTVVRLNGVLHGEFLGLYRKIRTGCEDILLSSNQMMELQEVEFHLWKVHYMLIDEFRKANRQLSGKKNDTLSGNVDSESQTDQVFRKFKSFLSEATKFYGDLIIKLRKSYGLPPEIFLKDRTDGSLNIASANLHVCHYTCHRLLICLGDIARYIEGVKKPNDCDWSTAGKYYIEATKIWPDGGNPHNQLALLATFIGDAFLATYHLVRSVAVKEPFPDAWRNLMLVLEESSSTPGKELSSQIKIDFSNPSKRISLRDTSPEVKDTPCTNEVHDMRSMSELWPIFVRTLGFLLTRSSLEGFQCAFATALHYLEALLTLDNTELTAALESYKYMGSSRKGPYRALQLVSIFIYIADSLTDHPKREDTTRNGNSETSFTPLAYAAIFICMGRLIERCTRDIAETHSPVFPAVTVFLDWLVGAIDAAEPHDADERVKNAKSYFIQALVDLLDRHGQSWRVIASEHTALWEDHELMGFYPLAQAHQNLDFTTHLDCIGDYKSGKEFRLRRIFYAATKITNRAKKILSSKEAGGEFNSAKIDKFLDSEKLVHMTTRKEESSMSERVEHDLGPKLEPTLDEEEVILFKPITRRNSAPLYMMKDYSDPLCSESAETHETRHDEILRRATSLSIGRATEADSFSFCTTTPDSGQNKSGPPSLSSWVLGKETEREKVQKNFNKQKLSPIDEIASTSFSQLSVNESKDELLIDHVSEWSQSSPTYVTPIPSAPSLPEDASWLNENSSIFPEYANSTKTEADGILGAAPVSSYLNFRQPMGFVPGVSGLVDGYPPFSGMSSSEWLYHYRTNQNAANGVNRTSPVQFNEPAFGNLHPSEITSFDICDQWGNRFISNPMVYMGRPSPQQVYPNSSLVYGAQEQNMEKMFLDYQRPFPYVCGVGMELSSDQLPLLQYLKEKEWQLQSGSQLKGPTYMRN